MTFPLIQKERVDRVSNLSSFGPFLREREFSKTSYVLSLFDGCLPILTMGTKVKGLQTNILWTGGEGRQEE